MLRVRQPARLERQAVLSYLQRTYRAHSRGMHQELYAQEDDHED